MRPHDTALGISLAAVGLPISSTLAVVGDGLWSAGGVVVAVACLWVVYDVSDLEVRAS